MKGVEGCGDGAWELVMRIKGGSDKVLNFLSPATLNTKRKSHKLA